MTPDVQKGMDSIFLLGGLGTIQATTTPSAPHLLSSKPYRAGVSRGARAAFGAFLAILASRSGDANLPLSTEKGRKRKSYRWQEKSPEQRQRKRVRGSLTRSPFTPRSPLKPGNPSSPCKKEKQGGTAGASLPPTPPAWPSLTTMQLCQQGRRRNPVARHAPLWPFSTLCHGKTRSVDTTVSGDGTGILLPAAASPALHLQGRELTFSPLCPFRPRMPSMP